MFQCVAYPAALSPPGSAGDFCSGALSLVSGPDQLQGDSWPSTQPAPLSCTPSARALVFPPNCGASLDRPRITLGHPLCPLPLANVTHAVVCVVCNKVISALFLHLSLGEICVKSHIESR